VVGKVIKTLRSEFFDVLMIKRFSFGFLEAKDRADRFIDFFADCIPFDVQAYSPDVLVKDKPFDFISHG